MAAPLVGIIMGSKSDLPIMRRAADMLAELEVPFEIKVISAHRTPDRLMRYMSNLEERGVRVLIAGAGGAAHLAGVAAAHTLVPVLGVPIRTETMGGLDSLLSIVQMPSGIPVGTLAIGGSGATNAALLAAQILAAHDPALRERIVAYRRMRAESQPEDVTL